MYMQLEASGVAWGSYNGNAVVVNVRLLVELLLDLSVLLLGPGEYCQHLRFS